MTDTLLAMVPHYGAWIVLVATFFSCLALPMPSSLIMLAAGAFAAAGELSLMASVGAAWGGAVVGDQTGYAIGAKGGAPLVQRLKRRKKAAETILRAEAMLHRRGVSTVFLTRWLFSPLGPYVNFVGGATDLPWRHFTIGSISGETVWVTLYVGLGFAFAGQIAEVAQIASNVAGFLAAGAMAVWLGWLIFHRRVHPHHGGTRR
ncbi:DedA family protein [Tropicibacter naphthalenivorans]|uniref:Inner membrane protein YabI n=1 Tax=Tropicibacter naphthalenivorans TaxID=441103 RepID=A0A0P1GST0_9RHOB|nr:VTT domain-containing protein [Tropicibacter naphthalenivorans]CUH78523.1 Inner membrane protein YabI [Tropicibacter naphthalenivorans]SMC80850.1 membrane protein DedA, SNARE-associated domain [Tropicibacter naphthalenivorans]